MCGSLVPTLVETRRLVSTDVPAGCENRALWPASSIRAANQLRVAKRLAPRRGASLGERFGRLDDRLVFVVGSPRSGTTFLAGAIGSVPGFVDLGEVAPVKAAIPELAVLGARSRPRGVSAASSPSRGASASSAACAPSSRRPRWRSSSPPFRSRTRTARIVHIVRDGRDVVCSLLEKPWLRSEQRQVDDAGVPYGSYARFWVEPERRARVRDGERRSARRVGVAAAT